MNSKEPTTSKVLCTADIRDMNMNWVMQSAGDAVAEALEKNGIKVHIKWTLTHEPDPLLGCFVVTPK